MAEQLLKKEGDINLGKRRQHWQAKHLNDDSWQTLHDDSRYFLHQAMSTPCLNVLEKAEGIWLQDDQGRRYMDFHGNNVHQVGFNHPHLNAALKQQLNDLSFCTRRYTNQVAVDCAKKLAELMPGDLNRVLFAPGGTSVVGMALKLARIVTGRHKVVSLWDSFHGASMDAIAVAGTHSFQQGLGPLLPGVERIPPATSYRGIWTKEKEDCQSETGSRGEKGGIGDKDSTKEYDDLAYADYLEYVLERDPEIGAFIAETVRNTDAQFPSKAYWQRVREICDRHNVLLILDEIPIALGRTGKMFAFEHYGVEPDILCLGKGLGGGIVPFAAMVTRDKFNIAEEVSLGHYTHEKSPLGAAAALATIEVIEQEALLEKVQQDEIYMRRALAQLQQKYELIGDVRGMGLLWGVELVEDRLSKTRANDAAEAVMYQCLSRGLSYKVSQGNVLQLSPPLIITREELDQALDILDQSLLAVSEEFGFTVHSIHANPYSKTESSPSEESQQKENAQKGVTVTNRLDLSGTFSMARQTGDDGQVVLSSTVPMSGLVSLNSDGIKVHHVPMITANQETFVKAGFGNLVTDFDQAEVDIVTWPKPGWREVVAGTGNEGGITEGEFVFTWEGDMAVARNHAVDGHYVTGWFTDPAQACFDASYQDKGHAYGGRRQIYVREANYHPDGSQIFYPQEGTPFIALLALPGDDVKPEDFVAFYCDGSFGVKIHPGIWHQPLFPLAERAVFNDKQGKVHACIAVDFVSEFDTYLSIALPK